MTARLGQVPRCVLIPSHEQTSPLGFAAVKLLEDRVGRVYELVVRGEGVRQLGGTAEQLLENLSAVGLRQFVERLQ